MAADASTSRPRLTAMETAFRRMASLLERRYLSSLPPDRVVSFALRTDSGLTHRVGHGPPAFAIVARSPRGIAALTTLDSSRIAEAYMRGDLDLDGDLMSVLALRALFSERHPLQFLWRFVQPLLFGQVESDRRWIAHHYDYPADFYQCFLDRRHRCYSQAVFERDDEPIEDAMTR